MAVNPERYQLAIETNAGRAVAHIVDLDHTLPRIVASSSSSARGTLETLVRLANAGALHEHDAELRQMLGEPTPDGWPSTLPRSADWAARDAEDGGS